MLSENCVNIGSGDGLFSVHENHPTHRTFPMARPKCLMRDFTNMNRILKAHRTNVWWIMKVFQLHCYCLMVPRHYTKLMLISTMIIILEAAPQEMLQLLIIKIRFKITYLKFPSYLPGANELKGNAIWPDICITDRSRQQEIQSTGRTGSFPHKKWYNYEPCHSSLLSTEIWGLSQFKDSLSQVWWFPVRDKTVMKPSNL